MHPPTPAHIRLLRLARLLLHLLSGLAQAGLLLPLQSDLGRARRVQAWSRNLLAILNVKIEVRGEPPPLLPGVLLALNHVSWLDIFVVDALIPARFVAKSDIRGWPVMGWLAERGGTLFIDRSRRHDTARMNHEMVHALAVRHCVAIFPEGTTTDGSRLKRFYPSLFQPAVTAGVPVVPVALAYRQPDGAREPAAAYVDDMSFWESLQRILDRREIRAEIAFLPQLQESGRREIAERCEQLIASALSLPAPRS